MAERRRLGVGFGRPPGSLLAVALLAVALFSACASGQRMASSEKLDNDPLLGVVSIDQILDHEPSWADALLAATPDLGAAERLAIGGPGTEIEIFLGTWCKDSRRELTRLWHALDAVGIDGSEIRYIGVDRDKVEPEELVAGRDIRFVPTVIVSKDGDEVGRIVESAPNGIEHDLAGLLDGSQSGTITGRDDLAPLATDDSDG